MNSILSALFVLSEGISLLLWLHIGFRKELRKTNYKCLFLIMYVFYYCGLSYIETGIMTKIIPGVLILCYVKKQFMEPLFSSIAKYVVSVLGMGLVQTAVFGIMRYLRNEIYWLSTSYIYSFVSLISLLVSILFFLWSRGKKTHKLRFDRYSILVLMYVVCIMLFIKLDYEQYGGIYSYLYFFLFVLLMFFIVILVRGLRVNHSLEQKQLEIEVREKYEEAYEKLILELRRRQHDYKNQLIAICGMSSSGNGNEELHSIKNQYAKELLEREQYDGLLSGMDNPVLAGYVYTLCNEAGRLGINVKPHIRCTKKEYSIATHEVIEILGILFNNAMEYLNEMNFENKQILVKLYEKNDKIHIMVSNTSERKNYEQLEKMFQANYSSKGEGRGLGLYSLKKIVKKNKGSLLVECENNDDENYLRIEAII